MFRIGKKHTYKQLKAECDRLWSECIKARGNYKSEISGKTGNLHAHHINAKASYVLRYSLMNGMSLTPGEHKFFAHHPGRYESFRAKVKLLRGEDIYEKLEKLKWCKPKVDLGLTKIYLQQKLKEFAKLENFSV